MNSFKFHPIQKSYLSNVIPVILYIHVPYLAYLDPSNPRVNLYMRQKKKKGIFFKVGGVNLHMRSTYTHVYTVWKCTYM